MKKSRYQKEILKRINKDLKDGKNVCYQLPVGFCKKKILNELKKGVKE